MALQTVIEKMIKMRKLSTETMIEIVIGMISRLREGLTVMITHHYLLLPHLDLSHNHPHGDTLVLTLTTTTPHTLTLTLSTTLPITPVTVISQ